MAYPTKKMDFALNYTPMVDHAANLRLIKTFGFLLAIFGSAFSNSFCGIGLGVYIGALAAELLFAKDYRWLPYPSPRLLLLLLASLLVSVVISDARWISVQGFGKYLQGFILLYAGIDVIRLEREKTMLVYTLVLTWLLAASSGINQAITGVDFVRGFQADLFQIGAQGADIMRLTGTFKHCNDYGTFLVPGVVFALAHFLGLWRQKKRGASLLAFLLLGAVVYVLLCTLSRGAILSACAALLVFSLFFPFRWRALLFLAGSVAALWFIHHFRGFGGSEMNERFLLLNTAFEMVRQNPLFGLGLNTYSIHFPHFKPADYPAFMYAHNTYLQMATEAGLVGVGLFLAFIAAVMKDSAKKQDLLGAALWAGAFGILVNGLFDSVLQSTQLRTIFWALLGAAAALSRLRA